MHRYHAINLISRSIEVSENTNDNPQNLPSILGFPKIISHGVKKYKPFS